MHPHVVYGVLLCTQLLSFSLTAALPTSADFIYACEDVTYYIDVNKEYHIPSAYALIRNRGPSCAFNVTIRRPNNSGRNTFTIVNLQLLESNFIISCDKQHRLIIVTKGSPRDVMENCPEWDAPFRYQEKYETYSPPFDVVSLTSSSSEVTFQVTESFSRTRFELTITAGTTGELTDGFSCAPTGKLVLHVNRDLNCDGSVNCPAVVYTDSGADQSWQDETDCMYDYEYDNDYSQDTNDEKGPSGDGEEKAEKRCEEYGLETGEKTNCGDDYSNPDDESITDSTIPSIDPPTTMKPTTTTEEIMPISGTIDTNLDCNQGNYTYMVQFSNSEAPSARQLTLMSDRHRCNFDIFLYPHEPTWFKGGIILNIIHLSTCNDYEQQQASSCKSGEFIEILDLEHGRAGYSVYGNCNWGEEDDERCIMSYFGTRYEEASSYSRKGFRVRVKFNLYSQFQILVTAAQEGWSTGEHSETFCEYMQPQVYINNLLACDDNYNCGPWGYTTDEDNCSSSQQNGYSVAVILTITFIVLCLIFSGVFIHMFYRRRLRIRRMLRDQLRERRVNRRRRTTSARGILNSGDGSSSTSSASSLRDPDWPPPYTTTADTSPSAPTAVQFDPPPSYDVAVRMSSELGHLTLPKDEPSAAVQPDNYPGDGTTVVLAPPEASETHI